MRRVPQPFFRKQTASWYVQIRGKQVSLGRDEEAARKEYHRIMSGEREFAPSTPAAVIFDQFLDWVKNNQAPATFNFYELHLRRFAKFLGARKTAADLKPYHVTKWVDRDYVGQSDTSKFSAFRSVQRAFNWAKKGGMIPFSPIAQIDKPTPGRRETYLTPEQYAVVLERVRKNERGEGPFHDLIVALWETGCRPMEVRTVTAKNYDAGRGVWIFERKQSKGKKKRRVVYLTPKVREVCDRRAAEFPAGPLFRNARGAAWTKDALNCRFAHLTGKKKTKPRKTKSKKPSLSPLPFPVHAYAFRHGFATDRLRKGVDSTTVAGLMGHTTTRMLETCYSHVDAHDDHMRQALNGTST